MNIKFLVMDVDGTLTDGKIYMGNNGECFKAFNIKDGYGVKNILEKHDIIPVIITGRESGILKKRCEELSIKYIYQGITDKLKKLDTILKDFSTKDKCSYDYSNCAYIGDDIADLECMRAINDAGGWTAAPNDAVFGVKENAKYISTLKCGEGAVRESIDYLVKNKTYNEDKLEKKINMAIEYIRQLDVSKLSTGCINVDDTFYINVEEYETRDKNECKLESHIEYVDIQYMVEGIEQIDTACVNSLQEEIAYDRKKDIVFWKDTKQVMHSILTPGSIMVLYPNNAHRPCMKVKEKSHVKKLIGKIKIDC